MAVLATIALATTVLEDNELLALLIALHRGDDGGGINRWLTNLDVGAISDEQYREGNLVTAARGSSLAVSSAA